MTGRIITVRHGRPALSRSVFISAQGYGDWWRQYDEGGLRPGQTPPGKLKALARQATTILSSTMPRAIETAEMIKGPHHKLIIDALFIEAPLPPPPLPEWLKLSPRWWGVISRTWWFYGYTPDGMETRSQAWIRVDQIIDRLSEHARHGDVVLCAHGYLNWMISRRIKQRGWKMQGWRLGNKYWSRRVYAQK